MKSRKAALQYLFLLVIVAVIVFSLLRKSPGANPEETSVQAISVYDGDTIRILINHRRDTVRLLGIDCPEKSQKYGPEATAFTSEMLGLSGKKKVPVKLEFDIQRRDKYGRLLAYVFNHKGSMVNRGLVENGLAVTLSIRPNVRYRDEFKNLMQQAKKNRLNIWDPDDPLTETPSEYRRKHSN